MKRQQVTEYQSDLFSAVGEDSACPYVNSEVVNGAIPSKVSQVKEAGEQKRALAQNLMDAILCQSNIKLAYKQVKRRQRSSRNRPNEHNRFCYMV